MTQNNSIRPYADTAWEYRRAGFQGVIPIGRGPAQKSPPPAEYTGWAGKDPSGADVQAWVDGREGTRNIGWHIPRGIVGVDVDDYHGGGESLRKLEDKVGHVLPPTWTSTARGRGSVTRHYFYRADVPEGRTWRDHPGVGIDSLHVGHRYAMVWPSVNPDADGAEVTWYDPDGEPYEGVPELGWFTAMDGAWIEELTQDGVPLEGAGASDAETAAALERFRLAPACPRVQRHLAKELDRITAAASGVGSLHDPGALYPLVAYGIEGHAGVREALATHQAAYVKARVDSRGETEGASDADWWRQVRGAVGKKLHQSGGVILTGCNCGEPVEENLDEVQDPVDALLARMLTREQLASIPKPMPLIKGLLDLNSESWIIGAPGGFKSFVALDWACHVATGKTWRGCDTTRGRVVYVVAEGAKKIRFRVEAWEAMYEARADDLICLPEPVQVKDGETDRTGKPSREWRVLVEACRRLQPVLIVLDTQARITVGLEENSNTSMGVLVEAVRLLKEATGACVLVVHHTGRNGEDARGASALDGAQDTEIRVDRPQKPAERARLTATISIDKQKDGDESACWSVQMHEVAVSEEETSLALGPWDPFDTPKRAEPEWDANLTGNQADVLAALRKIGNHERGATSVEVARTTDEMRQDRGAPKLVKTSFYTARAALAEKNLIVINGTRFYLPEYAPD